MRLRVMGYRAERTDGERFAVIDATPQAAEFATARHECLATTLVLESACAFNDLDAPVVDLVEAIVTAAPRVPEVAVGTPEEIAAWATRGDR